VSLIAPQSFGWTPGSSHTIGATSPQGSGSSRQVFASWSDGGAASHSVTSPAAATTYTADFTTQYMLTTAASPVSGGSVAASPSSVDGFYASGTSVRLTATANTSNQFATWSGDLTGTTNPQSVILSAPRTVGANFQSAAVPVLTAEVIDKADARDGLRVWAFRLANRGLGTAFGAQITSVSASQTAGILCSPAVGVITALPVMVGDIPPAANAMGAVTLNFSGCDKPARFTVKVAFTANGGTYSGSTTISNQTK